MNFKSFSSALVVLILCAFFCSISPTASLSIGVIRTEPSPVVAKLPPYANGEELIAWLNNLSKEEFRKLLPDLPDSDEDSKVVSKTNSEKHAADDAKEDTTKDATSEDAKKDTKKEATSEDAANDTKKDATSEDAANDTKKDATSEDAEKDTKKDATSEDFSHPFELESTNIKTLHNSEN